MIDAAYEDDPIAAAAEYGAEFRRDVEAFLPADALAAVRMLGRFEQPFHAPHRSRYVGFLDPAGGTGADSMTLAIAHHADGRAVLDVLREVTPPFSPEATVAEFADVLKAFSLTTATSDRYAGSWPTEAFRKLGITVEPSTRTKSEIYQDVLPLVMSGTCELLDHARLLKQFGGLGRRTARGGKDSIDHAPRQQDDVANAAAGALVLAAAPMLPTLKKRRDLTRCRPQHRGALAFAGRVNWACLSLTGGNRAARTLHAERPTHTLARNVVQTPMLDGVDNDARQVEAEAVIPDGARLVQAWEATERIGNLSDDSRN